MIPQALTNPISFFRATPPPPESAPGPAWDSPPAGWFFSALLRCLAPFSIFLSRVAASKCNLPLSQRVNIRMQAERRLFRFKCPFPKSGTTPDP